MIENCASVILSETPYWNEELDTIRKLGLTPSDLAGQKVGTPSFFGNFYKKPLLINFSGFVGVIKCPTWVLFLS